VRPLSLFSPLFIAETGDRPLEIATLPGHLRHTRHSMIDGAKELAARGAHGVILYGGSSIKSARPSAEHPLIEESIATLKSACPELLIIADLCICHLTDHGHCGILHDDQLLDDVTCTLLAERSIRLGRAGADGVMPSAMADGLVQRLRSTLEQEKLSHLVIMSQAIKHASPLFAPHRTATSPVGSMLDKKSYQTPISNRYEALREGYEDMSEGADIVIVKPALTNLDLIETLRATSTGPLGAFSTSGEHAMLCAGIADGLLDSSVHQEAINSMHRAGAQCVVTYSIPYIKNWSKK
jgi:porphobilinogen synthase